jgi:hypothetical protein
VGLSGCFIGLMGGLVEGRVVILLVILGCVNGSAVGYIWDFLLQNHVK